ncbi:MAG: tetratricopeptide repeat protein [Flavobacteriaceae bacterium]|nr:tetratricopeptide repeat protein [Flavobacteriaceae bacterium]
MKQILLFLLCIGYFSQSQNNTLSNLTHEEILQRVRDYSNKKDYEKGIKFIDSIHPNDSVYASALTTKSYFLLNAQRYEEALAVADEGLELNNPDTNFYFYMNKGVALVNLKKYEAAQQNYDTGLAIYPLSYQLLYNKGTAYEGSGAYAKAVEMYKKAIQINPYYAKPHLQLGKIAYKQHKWAQALMCLTTYLMISPDGSDSFSVLKYANDSFSGRNENEPIDGLVLSEDDDAFAQIDLILENRVALNADYTIPGEMDFPLIKQSHVLVELLKDFKGNGGFWDKRYVPVYQWIAAQENFVDFSYTISYPVQNDNYKKIVNEKIPQIKAFLGGYHTVWEASMSPVVLQVDGEMVQTNYYYKDQKLYGVGLYEADTPKGLWKFYTSNGQLEVVGHFDDKGERQGKWLWYNNLGGVKEEGYYETGKLNGTYLEFHPNGKKHIESHYKAGQLDGTYQKYTAEGALIERKNYVESLLDGKYESFYPTGDEYPEFVYSYVRDSIHGPVVQYYENGKVMFEVDFDMGQRLGVEKHFYPDGSLQREYTYQNGMLNGSLVFYYQNGVRAQEAHLVDGKYEGEAKRYFPNGMLSEVLHYKSDQLDGVYNEFDLNGHKLSEYIYKDDELISYKFFGKDNSLLSQGDKKKGGLHFEGYSRLGYRSTSGKYTDTGSKTGEWITYATNGAKATEEHFKEGLKDGSFVFYYPNGQIESEETYLRDTIVGVDINNHKSGKLNYKTYYNKGEAYGAQLEYYQDGTLSEEVYYHRGKKHGKNNFYSVDGKLNTTHHYVYDQLVKSEYFNPDGSLLQTADFTKFADREKVILYHPNGNISHEVGYVYGLKNGDYKEYYFDGKPFVEFYNLNGKIDGPYKQYFQNGQLSLEATYINGLVHGTTTSYYENGQLEYEKQYVLDEEFGKRKDFYEDGTLEIETDYLMGKAHGKKLNFSPDGVLQLIRYYDYGTLIGYSYLNQKGDTLPMIALPQESGKMEAFFQNGNKSFEATVQFGEYIQDYKMYYASGQLYRYNQNKDGDYHGDFILYFPDGKEKARANYVLGDLQGTSKVFYKNGQVKKIVNYLNDLAHGSYEEYDEQGKMLSKKLYHNGNIIKEEKL